MANEQGNDTIEVRETGFDAVDDALNEVADAAAVEAAEALFDDDAEGGSPYVEPFEDEYDFDAEPVVKPKPIEQRPKRPVSPVVTYHKKTQRNSFMLIIAGIAAAGCGLFLTRNDMMSTIFAIFLSALGIGVFAVGFISYRKTARLLPKARKEFAQDRAMRVYLACEEAGIDSCESDDDKSRILSVAMKQGFDIRDEAVGLFKVGSRLVAEGKKPNPDYDNIGKKKGK